ncbi:MAG: thiosulfate oxidation carrier protein SoxY [Gammaproteobacteria bacterium]
MNQTRRTLLRASMAAGVAAVASAAGLLSPRAVLAAGWPKPAFEAESVDSVLAALGGAEPNDSQDVKVQAPDIAENGAVVSVTVETSLPNVESISVVARDNTRPLAASYLVAEGTDGFISSRIKMRKTSDVIAVVKANGKFYTAKKAVKVTLGGCGG